MSPCTPLAQSPGSTCNMSHTRDTQLFVVQVVLNKTHSQGWLLVITQFLEEQITEGKIAWMQEM